jgi:hypothetical protein
MAAMASLRVTRWGRRLVTAKRALKIEKKLAGEEGGRTCQSGLAHESKVERATH